MLQKFKILYLNCIYNGDNDVAHCRYGPCTSVSGKFFWTMKDYYKILGVDKTVSGTEIKKRFRQQALQVHPDKSRTNTTDEFIELFEAYEILSKKKKRDRYDKLYSLLSTETTEVKDEKLRTDIKRILDKGRVYAGDFIKFDREILGQIILELFFDPSYVLFASGASIFFGLWTIIKGLTILEWDYSLIGVALTTIGVILARSKIIEIQKTSR